MTIHLVTDSTSQLTTEEINKYDIHIIPLIINDQGKSFKDGIDITSESFLSDLQTKSEITTTTSQPAVGDFVDLYNELGKDNEPIISIHLTNLLSGTVEGAFSAASQTESNVTVIDSKLMDRGLGEQVLLAAQLIKEGKTVDEIVAALQEAHDKKTTDIFFESLDALQRGGRISKLSGAVSKLLKIKAFIRLFDDELKLMSKGYGRKFINKTLEKTFSDLNGVKLDTFTLVHVGMNEDRLIEIKELVKTTHPEADFRVVLTSPIIMNHVGLGTFAFVYSKH